MTDLELLLTPADERAAQAREPFWAGRGSTGALYDAIEAARHAAFLRDANAAGIIDVDSGSDSGEEDEEDDAGEEADGSSGEDDGGSVVKFACNGLNSMKFYLFYEFYLNLSKYKSLGWGHG